MSGASGLSPSPLYSGERAGVRGERGIFRRLLNDRSSPLTLTLSPEYRGEGISACLFSFPFVGNSLRTH